MAMTLTDSTRARRQVWLGWLPVLIWMGLIFSASTDNFSAAHTSRFIEPLLRWLSRGRLSNDAIGGIHFLVRKLAHLTEYAVLAVLTWNALRLSVAGASRRRLGGLTVLIAALYAASDEFHQSFIPSREATVRDVCIDTAGAIAGLLLLACVRHLGRQRKQPIGSR